MKFLVGLLLAFASCLALGCPPGAVNPPPDADGSTGPGRPSCADMCARLKALECAEGFADKCEDACLKALQDPGIPDPPVACVVRATDQASVVGCGMTCHVRAMP